MLESRCEDLEYLPIHYSWNRHCGGGPWEFTSRSFAFVGGAALLVGGARMAVTTYPLGTLPGSFIAAKGGSDMYESATGKRSAMRNLVGDIIYDLSDFVIFGYGLFKMVPKMNYLGNPMRDFFIKDPANYEFALRQFTTLKIIQETASLTVSSINHYDKYKDMLFIEEVWDKHLKGLEANDE